MLALLSSLLLFLLPVGAEPTDSSKQPQESWVAGYLKPEILAAIGIPLVGAITWLVRDYISKDQEVGRARFKEEIISCLQTTLEAANRERDAIVSLKLNPLESLLERLNNDLREGRITDKEVQAEIEEIQNMIADLNMRLRVVESNFNGILNKLNSELSSVLTACTGETVKVRLFMSDDIELND